MSARRIVFLDSATFLAPGEEPADAGLDRFERWSCELHPGTGPGELVNRAAGCAVIVTNKARIDADAIGELAGQGLELIAVAATGTNNVDLDAAREHGVAVTNVVGYSTPAVAQHTLGLILELASRVGAYHRRVVEGEWERSPSFALLDEPTTELEGKVLGVIGAGNIGRRVAELGRAFGMEVLLAARRGAEPGAGRTAFEEVLERADVVTLHCPLTEETAGLIGAPELDRMKPGAFLVNASRGGLVDEQALIEALRTGRLGGAGFDVATAEPPPADHPLVAAARVLPNLVLTPHTAWTPRETRRRLLGEVAANVEAFERGEQRNRVT